MENLFTLITWEHESSQQQTRNDLSYSFCRRMAQYGGFYKVQIVNQDNASIEEYKAA